MTLAVSSDVVLIDTSVWIDHFRISSPVLIELIESRRAATHEVVFGELLLGAIPRGDRVVEDFVALPFIVPAPHSEVVEFARMHRLEGSGIGWVDTHLLAAATAARCLLWTADSKLKRVASRVGVDFGGG